MMELIQQLTDFILQRILALKFSEFGAMLFQEEVTFLEIKTIILFI